MVNKLTIYCKYRRTHPLMREITKMSESESILSVVGGMYVAQGNMKVEGNLEVENQISAAGLKINDTDGKNLVSMNGN